MAEESVLFGKLLFLPETWDQDENDRTPFSLDPLWKHTEDVSEPSSPDTVHSFIHSSFVTHL